VTLLPMRRTIRSHIAYTEILDDLSRPVILGRKCQNDAGDEQHHLPDVDAPAFEDEAENRYGQHECHPLQHRRCQIERNQARDAGARPGSLLDTSQHIPAMPGSRLSIRNHHRTSLTICACHKDRYSPTWETSSWWLPC
jgi:hypothetical protein